MRNLPNFAKRPAWLGERYDPLLKRARSKGLTSVEQTQYLRAMVSDKEIDKVARAYLRRGREEGRELGRKEESLRIAKNLLAAGIKAEEVALHTGLSEEEISSLT